MPIVQIVPNCVKCTYQIVPIVLIVTTKPIVPIVSRGVPVPIAGVLEANMQVGLPLMQTSNEKKRCAKMQTSTSAQCEQKVQMFENFPHHANPSTNGCERQKQR